MIVQDAAHILLSYKAEPLSFLQVDGAKDVGVEVHSMSKGFNMIGWRLGWVCGHSKIVQAYADVKDNSDSGQFMAVQHAAAQALVHTGNPGCDSGEVQAAGWKSFDLAAQAKRVSSAEDARRHVLPLHRSPEGRG